MSEPIIRLIHADKYYKKGRSQELHVMNDINLELPETGMVAVYGRSGGGKTTLLNAIGGLDRIDSGEIELFGQNISHHTDTVRNRSVGYIFQNYNLIATETVFENVAVALRLCGVTDDAVIRERVMTALTDVGMDSFRGRTPDTLSGGQQQRVAIARALVKSPAIILADEPTGNLDENNTVTVMDILKAVSKTRLVLLVTHEARLVDYYCDRVIELSDGQVTSDRVNEQAEGYAARKKSDIYLGELHHREGDMAGVHVDFYDDGLPAGSVSLKLIRQGGKLYLKADTPSVQILDSGSEVRLLEGRFEPKKGEETGGHRRQIADMGDLPAVSDHQFGRLYHLKNAFLSAWRENFRNHGKKKRGRALFSVVMVLLSVNLAFMAATMSQGIRSYTEAKERSDPADFFIPLNPGETYTLSSDRWEENGIAHARLVTSEKTDQVSFDTSAFMSAKQVVIYADASVTSADFIGKAPAVCGKAVPETRSEVVITTAVADDLLSSSTLRYIRDYRDLLGLSASSSVEGETLRIAGVIRSKEHRVYLEPLMASSYILNRVGVQNLYPQSLTKFCDKPIGEGEIVFVTGAEEEGNTSIRKGDRLQILGCRFTVSDILHVGQDTYPDTDGMHGGYDPENPMEGFLLHDRDFIRLSHSMGPSGQVQDDGRLTDTEYLWGLNVYADGEGKGAYHSHYLAVHASDVSTAAACLKEQFGEGVITPEESFHMLVRDSIRDTLISVTVILTVLGLMCLCVYFIMRSSSMRRVKEIGILRAIGVTKKNLVFRFAVETMLLLLVTTIPAFLLSWMFIHSLADAPLFSSLFYFPWWIGSFLLLTLAASGILFGVLPMLTLLRNTPSRILSKYDI